MIRAEDTILIAGNTRATSRATARLVYVSKRKDTFIKFRDRFRPSSCAEESYSSFFLNSPFKHPKSLGFYIPIELNLVNEGIEWEKLRLFCRLC